jgi:hypothetical protein
MRSLKLTWAIIEHDIVKFTSNHNIIQNLEQLLKTIQKIIKFYKSKHPQHPFFLFTLFDIVVAQSFWLGEMPNNIHKLIHSSKMPTFHTIIKKTINTKEVKIINESSPTSLFTILTIWPPSSKVAKELNELTKLNVPFVLR